MQIPAPGPLARNHFRTLDEARYNDAAGKLEMRHVRLHVVPKGQCRRLARNKGGFQAAQASEDWTSTRELAEIEVSRLREPQSLITLDPPAMQATAAVLMERVEADAAVAAEVSASSTSTVQIGGGDDINRFSWQCRWTQE